MIYRGNIDFDKTELQPGDVLIGCNPSTMDGRTIAVDGLTFERCNMFGVVTRKGWVIKDCYHVGKTKADLPVPLTEDQLEIQKVAQLTVELAEIATRKQVLVQDFMKLQPALVTASAEVVKVAEEPIIKDGR